MYYRITTFTFDEDREDEVMAVAHAATDKLTAIAGIQSGVIVRVSPGKTITIASYDTQESAVAAQPQIKEILGQLAGMLTAPPEVQEGPVLLDFF
ncbi:MAG: hypothetical protein AAEI92_10825 [Arenicellales bacterium]|jgi:hypothetical protein